MPWSISSRTDCLMNSEASWRCGCLTASKGKPSIDRSPLRKVGDKLSHLPDSFLAIATTTNSPFAGIAHETKPYFGIQFHPEVTHTPRGTELLKNFTVNICEARQHWTMGEFVDKEIARIRQIVGAKGQVIGTSPQHVQELHYANFVQALYPEESTLRFVPYNELEN